MEEWRQIKEMEGYYVSSLGRVRSSNKLVRCRGNNYRIHKGKILSLGICNGEYPIVVISNHCETKTLKVHRLVAIAFIENLKGLEEVNHIDGNIENNNYKNLEWCSKKGNMDHAFRMGKIGSKITSRHLDLIKEMYTYSAKSFNKKWLSSCFHISEHTTRSILKGENKWKK